MGCLGLSEVVLEFLYHAAFGNLGGVREVMKRVIKREHQCPPQDHPPPRDLSSLPFRLLRAAVALGWEESALAAAQELRLIAALRPAVYVLLHKERLALALPRSC